ncbi:Na(+)-translocating NADH-quinone reductase subunit F [Andreesenia angusta]|uniref:Na(+)-translocating NADH-quinone reductase subunit F n=1 Tax=Andreesenia angusta TaxID=39480 RepID=A0A1S1V7K6_9FIRM|nr:2Fe-2S iron-sulfur cluster-binding protein [Andreesenia angusta]OHW62583.1 Na(+)-translocating NADH-quinone reductase subunit F [Andreesenia angusta]
MGKVKFINEVDAKKEKDLVKLAKKANVKIKLPCSGKGTCGKCIVKITKGEASEPTKAEIKKLGEEKIQKGYRLACQVEVLEDDISVKIID